MTIPLYFGELAGVVDALDPEAVRGAIRWSSLYDILRRLDHVRRFAGAGPMTVLEHSVLMQRVASDLGHGPRVQLGCLLHDAAEAYLGDTPAPVRRALPLLEQLHTTIQREIWALHVGAPLSVEDQAIVDQLDHASACYEAERGHLRGLREHLPPLLDGELREAFCDRWVRWSCEPETAFYAVDSLQQALKSKG